MYTQSQVQTAPEKPENESADANREERVQEPKILENPKTPRYVRLNHLENQIIGDKNKGVMTRRRLVEEICLISKIKPKSVDEACKDENWIKAMEEELNQIEKNDTWILLPRPKDNNVIGTKWVFWN